MADRTLPVLDRKKNFDERSRAFGVRAALPETVVRRRHRWDPLKTPLDQGNEGHCVGFGWSMELGGSPVRIKGINDQFGHALFYGAQVQDRRMGYNWPDGASVLAGAKEVTDRGFLAEYRWGFGIDDVIDTVVAHGPVVLGIDWTDGMYSTRPSGLVDTSGSVVGGHCITVFGYHPRLRLAGEGWLKRFEGLWWMNSWGPTYGKNGIGFITAESLDGLLKNGGEACVPVHRLHPKGY